MKLFSHHSYWRLAIVLIFFGLIYWVIDRQPKEVTTESIYTPLIKSGTPMADVESAMGPGESLPFESLPKFYQTVIARGNKGKDYRRWIKTDGDLVTTIHTEFKNGVTYRPFIETALK